MPDKEQAALAISEIVDLERYPLVDLASDRRQQLVDRCRADLRAEGACQLDRLLLPGAVGVVVEEALRLSPMAFRTEAVHNVYFVDIPSDPDEDDLRGVAVRSAKRALSWKHLDGASPLSVLYQWDGLVSFLREVLELPSLYRDADPVGACSVMFYDENDELGWHFDNSEFAVTLMLQASENGGAFEFVPAIRDLEDEHAGAVRAILAGEQERVRSLDIELGTFTLFQGRYSLHRVTPITGDRPRINAVLAYATEPGHQLTPLTRELFYGPDT
jgi:hypothetical protein